jgi:hypothetical protein
VGRLFSELFADNAVMGKTPRKLLAERALHTPVDLRNRITQAGGVIDAGFITHRENSPKGSHDLTAGERGQVDSDGFNGRQLVHNARIECI